MLTNIRKRAVARAHYTRAFVSLAYYNWIHKYWSAFTVNFCHKYVFLYAIKSTDINENKNVSSFLILDESCSFSSSVGTRVE